MIRQSQSKVNAILQEINITTEYITDNNLWDGEWLTKDNFNNNNDDRNF
tara:strand:+ start:399 stop:545 length:147 start_codon:yes stop_codon:yes gene_type:complete